MDKTDKSEREILSIICSDCDELDGWGFTRLSNVMNAIFKALGNRFDGTKVGNAIAGLMEKNLIDVEASENEVWVSPEVYEAYC